MLMTRFHVPALIAARNVLSRSFSSVTSASASASAGPSNSSCQHGPALAGAAQSAHLASSTPVNGAGFATNTKSSTPSSSSSSSSSASTTTSSASSLSSKDNYPVAVELPPGAKNYRLSAKHVQAALKRISSTVHRSPLEHSPLISNKLGCSVYLKMEHLSITGSYKERGALNKLLQLTDEEKKRGVICSSAGNHAQAVSYHSTRLGIDGTIVMPTTTPHTKVKATKDFGGRVVQAGESFQQAYENAVEIAKKEQRTFIHAFNDSEIVAGQGTLAIEMLEQNPFLDAIIVPIGGGGLIAGMSLLLKHVNPRIKVYGVESVAMPGMKESVKKGEVVKVTKKPSMADGIAIERIGDIPFAIIKDHVDDIVTVDEDEIAAAVLDLLEKEKTVVEGSGAVGLAALTQGKLPDLEGKNVAIILTGGNIDMSLLTRIIEKGLVKTGRLARIHVTVLDQPGQLARVLEIIRDHRANVKDIEHERAFLLGNVGITQPAITIETRGFDHVREILDSLAKGGFENVRLATPRE